MSAAKTAMTTAIVEALNKGGDVDPNGNTPAAMAQLRQETADEIATAVQTYFKASLNIVIGGGVATPQDGGTALKTTMMAQIANI